MRNPSSFPHLPGLTHKDACGSTNDFVTIGRGTGLGYTKVSSMLYMLGCYACGIQGEVKSMVIAQQRF